MRRSLYYRAAICNRLGKEDTLSPATYDIVTVGGGLAASAFAKSMAESGAKILILEQESRFKDRIRGEFISPWGVEEAKQLGILDVLCKSCATKIRWVDMGPGPRDVVATTMQQLPALSYSHPEMQKTLLDAAEKAGAEVRRGVRVQGLEAGESPVVVAANGGAPERISARLVVAADGRGSLMRKLAGFAVERDPHPFLMAGVLLSGLAVQEDMVRIIFNPELGMVASIMPQSGGRCRSYLGYPVTMKYRLQGNDSFDLFLSEVVRAIPMFAPMYANAKSIGPLASFDADDSWAPHPYRSGVALIGDAAATSDPSYGQGMCLALRDARVLRDHLLRSPDWTQAGHQYAAEHDSYFHNCHTATTWFRAVFQEQSREANLRRQKAMPLIMKDPTRVPDHLFSGPELPLNDGVRARFFGEA